MRSLFAVVVFSFFFGLVVSSPVRAQSTPRLIANGSVRVPNVLGEEFGPDGGRVEISNDLNGAIDTPTIAIDRYFATASARASYGILRASAAVEFSGVATRFSPTIITATATSNFTDSVSFDSAGLTGQSGFAAMTITLSGTSSAAADGNLWTSGGGGLSATVGGVTTAIRNGTDTISNTPNVDPPTQTLMFEIVFGDLVDLYLRLNSTVTARANSGLVIDGSGSASGLFGNTAGVNGFEVFDQSMNAVDFTFTSQSGEFEFYPVPEPTTGLLMGLGLVALASHRRPRE